MRSSYVVALALVLVGCRSRLLEPIAPTNFDNSVDLAVANSVDLAVAGGRAWPTFQHDGTHSGRSPFAGPTTPKLKWSFKAPGPTVTLPVIGDDGAIYVRGGQSLNAINPDGTKRWSFGPINVTAYLAIGSDGTLYAGAGDNKLYAISASGAQKWTFTAGDVVGGATLGRDGTIYVASLDNRLYALKPDGTLKWSFALDDGGYFPPAVGDDGTIYVGAWRNYVPSAVHLNLYALNPDGTVKWAYQANGVVYTPVVGSDGTVYVRTGGATLNAIDGDGHEKWRAPVDIYMRSAPALASDGTIYVGTGQSTLSALDPASGRTKWTFYRSDLCSECSPTVGGDGTIYMIGFERRVYAVAPDGSERWTFAVDADHTGPEDAIAIGSDGTLYVGSQGDTLYAIGR